MTSIALVRDFMAKDLITFSPDMDVYKAIDIMVSKKISGASVIDENQKMVGILSEKDCLRILAHDAYHNLPGGTVADYMSEIVMTVHPNTDIFSAAVIFLQNHYRRLPVVENDKLVGQISRRDVLKAIQKLKGSG